MSNNDNDPSGSYNEHEEYKEYKYGAGGAGERGHVGHIGNGRTSHREREQHAENMTGALPALGATSASPYIHTESPEFEYLIQSLHDLFARDRQLASQTDTTRCGICYLYFPLSDLHYRDEGFYVCLACEHALGKQRIFMLHRQQKL